MKPETIKAFKALLDQIVAVGGHVDGPIEFNTKIDLLEHALACLRIERHHVLNEQPFEKFIACDSSVKNGRLVINLPRTYDRQGAGTHAIRLQTPLLVFL